MNMSSASMKKAINCGHHLYIEKWWREMYSCGLYHKFNTSWVTVCIGIIHLSLKVKMQKMTFDNFYKPIIITIFISFVTIYFQIHTIFCWICMLVIVAVCRVQANLVSGNYSAWKCIHICKLSSPKSFCLNMTGLFLLGVCFLTQTFDSVSCRK